MKKHIYKSDFKDPWRRKDTSEEMKERGYILLKEAHIYKELYLQAVTESEQNTYYALASIFYKMASYDFGFKNASDFYAWIDIHGAEKL